MHTAQLTQLRAQAADVTRERDTYRSLYKSERDISATLEATIDKMMTMIRKYCYDKEMELINSTKVWNERLQHERDVNLEMRLEHSRWQEGLGRAMHYAREALRSASEDEEPFAIERAELAHENRFMRRLLGWDAEESDDEGEDAPEVEGEQANPA